MKKNIFNYTTALGFFSTIMLTSFSSASGFPNTVSWNYSCLTSKNYILTYAGNNTYTSFDTSEEPKTTDESNPNFVLRNGRITYQTKQKLVMTWKNGNYTYQLTFFGKSDPGSISESLSPLSGNIVVKKGKKVLSNQRCIKVGSREMTSF